MQPVSPTRVLIIDGEASRRRSMRRYLASDGMEVVEGPEPGPAIELARSGAFDLIIVNADLPEIEGVELCRRLKSTPETSQTPILQVAVQDDHMGRARALEGGADAFLTIPLDEAEFIAQARALLRVRQIEKARDTAEQQLERQKAMLAQRNLELRDSIRALKEKERRLRLLFDRNPDAVFSLDRKGSFTFFNPACVQIMGHSEERLQGMSFLSLCTPESGKAWGVTFTALVVGRMDRAELEVCVVRKAGPNVYLWVTAEVSRQDGEILEVHCTARDITNRKHAEDELRQTQERMRLHLENSPLGRVDFSSEGRIVSWSAGATRIFGWKAEEVLGKMVWDIGLIYPQDVPSVRQLFELLFTGVNTRMANINRNVRKDGSLVWCEWYNSIIGEQGSAMKPETVSLSSLVLDISRRKAAEERAMSAAALDHYRVSLNDTLRGLSDPVQIQAAAAKTLAEALGVQRVIYAEILNHSGDAVVLAQWCCGAPEAPGTFRMEDYGKALMEELWAGRPIVIEDAAHDSWLRQGENKGNVASVPVACVVFPLIKDGRPISILAVHQDTPRTWTGTEMKLVQDTAERTWAVVERARAEAELRRSESFYRQALESIPGMVFTTRANGECDYLNLEWVHYTGKPLSDHLGSGWLNLLHPEDKAGAMYLWRAALAGKARYDLEYRVRRKDGCYEWFKVIARPILDQEGNVARWFGTAMNIERLKQAEQALTESEERLRLAQEGGGVGVYDVDLVKHRITWTAQLERLYGVEAPDTFEEYLAAWRKLVHPDDLARLDSEQRQWLESSLNESYTEYRLMRPDGTFRWIGVKAMAIRDEQGKVTRVIGTNTDITERKAFEGELERLVTERTAELQRTNEQLNAFCYSIAHDLKAPLRAQTAFATLLEEQFGKDLGDVGRSYARKIAEAAARQNKLVADLLSHMSIARTDLPLSNVDLAAIVSEAQADLAMEIASREASVTIEPLSLHVEANAASLHLVVQNLLSNALKFVEPGRKPVIHIREEQLPGTIPARVRLWIEDNGIGIDPRYHDRIFGMFQRLHTEKNFPGTGMGLAIVRKAMERMGGRVGLLSEAGEGCRFWIELNAAQVRVPATP